ncbi:unnamed protein product [Closterium sp. NIES-65]|nr:unnamed protein product [Closterium sp. NIES-65]
MELLRDSDDWADVEPLPQDDGPDPVVPIAYSREFDDAMGFMRAVLASGERSARVLRLTERVISVNAASYTAWQLRRDVLTHLLSLAEPEATTSKPSSTSADENRGDEGDWLVQDEWVAREFDTWHGELTFCEKLLDDDVRNNSAWNHRMFVLEHLIAKQKQGAEHVGGGANQEKDSEIRVTPVTVEDEVTFAVTAIWLAPSNESPWRYLQGLIRLLEKEAEGVGKEGDLRLLGICMDVLASEPECVHALATLLSVLGRGCMSDKVGKVLGLSQDGAGDSAAISCTDAAVALCEKLQKVDKIRRGPTLTAWTDAYGLAAGSVLPPSRIALPPNVPPPPHLEDCATRTAQRRTKEMRGPNGEPPRWTRARGRCRYPQPPWVGIGRRGNRGRGRKNRGAGESKVVGVPAAPVGGYWGEHGADAGSGSPCGWVLGRARGGCRFRQPLWVGIGASTGRMPVPAAPVGGYWGEHGADAGSGSPCGWVLGRARGGCRFRQPLWVGIGASTGRMPVPAAPVGGYWGEHGADAGSGSPCGWVLGRAGGGCRFRQPLWVGIGPSTGRMPVPAAPVGGFQVRGSDAANLAATRQAQADIWRHQFPNESPSAAKSAAATSSAATSSAATSSAATSAAAASSFQSESNPVASTSACSGRRLFVVDWPKRKHGIGSQLSIVSAYLSLALTHNRTLVPTPGTYIRANHSECLEAGNLNSFDCYFFPLVAKSCEERVREAMGGGVEAGGGVGSRVQTMGEGEGEAAEGKVDGADGEKGREWEGACADHSNVRALLGSDRPIVRFCGNYLHLKYEAGAARLWGSAYLRRRNSIEVRGRVKASVPRLQQVHWWRAQSLRFMLRWPSAYLCHVSNRVRQQAYGLHVAVRIEESRAAQKRILDSLGAAAAAVGDNDDNNEAGGKEGYDKEGEEGEEEEQVYRRVGGEVYMPRPVVSVHVRQGDKEKEMRLSSFRAYILHVQRLRLRVPDVHYVWLSTEMQSQPCTQMLEYEKTGGRAQLVGMSFLAAPLLFSSYISSPSCPILMFSLSVALPSTHTHPSLPCSSQSVIDELDSYSDWTFMYSKNKRQLGSTQMLEYERAAGLEQLVGVSFANLLIASECDFFVGPLGSNWNRLINNLRDTNGRVHAGYVALNTGEW